MPSGAAEQTIDAQATPAEQAPNLFVVPVYNEVANLPRLIVDLEDRPWLFPPGSRIIVVDDGSEDGTPQLVTDYTGTLPLQLVRLPENQGPGAAFRAGFAAALQECSDDAYVVTLEGDTTSDLDALPRMLDTARESDLVLASWRMVNVSAHRRFLSAAAGFVVRHALGLDAKTVSSFFRVYRASALRAASGRYGPRLIEEPGFACKAELLGKFARMGARIEEVTVDLDWGRREGKSKMPLGKTMLAYWRMLFRSRAPQEPAEA